MSTTEQSKISAEIAETILAQLGGSGRLRAMLSAKDFMSGTADLTFKFAAKATNGANCIQIKLDGDDTYTMVWYHIGRGCKVTPKGETSGIQVEGLRRSFELATGLYLSL